MRTTEKRKRNIEIAKKRWIKKWTYWKIAKFYNFKSVKTAFQIAQKYKSLVVDNS